MFAYYIRIKCIVKKECALSSDSSFNWPDARLGQLDPTDARFSLPGMVGSSHPLETSTGPAQPQKPSFPDSELLTEELPYERHSSVLEQFITVNHEVIATVCLQKGITMQVKLNVDSSYLVCLAVLF